MSFVSVMYIHNQDGFGFYTGKPLADLPPVLFCIQTIPSGKVWSFLAQRQESAATEGS